MNLPTVDPSSLAVGQVIWTLSPNLFKNEMSIVSLARLLQEIHESTGRCLADSEGLCQWWLFVVLRTSGMDGLFPSSFANLQQLSSVPH